MNCLPCYILVSCGHYVVLTDAGNALTVAVLRLDTDKTNSTTWLLQALAAVDTVYLAACLVIQPLKVAHELYGGVLAHSFPVIERYVWPLAATAQTATVWIVLLVTGDRYAAVCRPFQAHWRSVEKTRLAVIVAIVLAVLYNLPQWFEREVVWETNLCTGLPDTRKIKKVSLILVVVIIIIIIITTTTTITIITRPIIIITTWRGGVVVTASDLQPRGRRFDYGPLHVTTLGKLFTYMCLCSPSSINW